MRLKKLIRDVPDFPKQGIVFKDITTLLSDGKALRRAVSLMAKPYRKMQVDKVVAIEARGFIFGALLAFKLGCGLVPARKKGKLPFRTITEEYALEYGTSTLELHSDAIAAGEKVIIVDDLLATGGTALAAARLVERLGGEVLGIEFLIELEFLKGRQKLLTYPVRSIIRF